MTLHLESTGVYFPKPSEFIPKASEEYYKAKKKLAEQQTRLDLLLGRSLDDY